VKKLKQEVARITKEITPKLVKNVYTLLEKKSPEKIVQMLEAVIGILRDRVACSNVDVEVKILKLTHYLVLFEIL